VTRLAAAAGLLGLAIATALLVRAGLGPVAAAFAAGGAGVALATLFHLVPMALNARAWQLLAGRGRGRTLRFFTWLVWVREAVNGLLPVARVGGEVATARMLTRHGVRTAPAVASLVLDVTLTLVTQAVFTLIGLGLLAARHPGSVLARPAWLCLAAGVPIVAALIWVQRSGALRWIERIVRLPAALRAGASPRRLDRAVQALWRRRARLVRSAGWQLAGWVAMAGELWIFLRAAGAPIPVLDAVLIEALVQALASAAFVVPGALGVQEGAFLALGGVVGLSPDVALALALSRRARDVLLFVPALIVWQLGAGRRLLHPQRGRAACDGPEIPPEPRRGDCARGDAK
jgi:putative membrane protein